MKKLTRRAAKSSEFPAFSWETLLLATDRRRVGEPVEAVADILIDLFGYLREDNCQRGRGYGLRSKKARK